MLDQKKRNLEQNIDQEIKMLKQIVINILLVFFLMGCITTAPVSSEPIITPDDKQVVKSSLQVINEELFEVLIPKVTSYLDGPIIMRDDSDCQKIAQNIRDILLTSSKLHFECGVIVDPFKKAVFLFFTFQEYDKRSNSFLPFSVLKIIKIIKRPKI